MPLANLDVGEILLSERGTNIILSLTSVCQIQLVPMRWDMLVHIWEERKKRLGGSLTASA